MWVWLVFCDNNYNNYKEISERKLYILIYYTKKKKIVVRILGRVSIGIHASITAETDQNTKETLSTFRCQGTAQHKVIQKEKLLFDAVTLTPRV